MPVRFRRWWWSDDAGNVMLEELDTDVVGVLHEGVTGSHYLHMPPGATISQHVVTDAQRLYTLSFWLSANFLEDIEDSPFISDFHPPAPPEGSESVKDEELEPSTVWAFPLSLELQDPEERK